MADFKWYDDSYIYAAKIFSNMLMMYRQEITMKNKGLGHLKIQVIYHKHL